MECVVGRQDEVEAARPPIFFPAAEGQAAASRNLTMKPHAAGYWARTR